MDKEKILAIQNRMIALQQNIKETAMDADDKIIVSINGKMQISDLSLDRKLTIEEIESKLPSMLNDIIQRASIKVQEALKIAMQS